MKHGIKVVGDLPIFVAPDSADVWTNPEEFQLDKNGTPTVVAGVPPDYFSTTGSSGAILCTTGIACLRTDSNGGSNECEPLLQWWISRASITFVVLLPVGNTWWRLRPLSAVNG
jgi:hypothetical protein